MKKYRLKISGQDFDELQRLVLVDMPREAAAFALAGIANLQSSTDVIVRRIIAIPKEFYDYQDEYHLRIKPQAVNGLIALSESNGLSAVLCHSHAEGFTYSPSDDYGEGRIVKALQPFVPPGSPIASLLISPKGVNGRIWLPNTRRPIPISEIVVLDGSLRHIRLTQATQTVELNEIYDRQVRAFGAVGQEMITQAKVAVIGVGGTGSPVAEQLVRLGVIDLVLIDPDRFDPSNVTRVYGTFSSSIRRLGKGQPIYKVEEVASNLKRINPKVTIRAIPKNIVLTEVAMNILDRDVVFLCTDEHWGRSIVNQLSYQYFIPVINLGARIASKGGEIMAAVGTVDIIRPDKPCLWCSQFLKADRITAESMPYRDRPKLQQEGYVENLETKAPSVVSITTTIAGMSVTMFLQLITDFMGTSGNISRINYDVMDGTVRRGSATISAECICKKVRGFGDLMPSPTLSDLEYLNS